MTFHFGNFQAITRVPDLFDIWSQAENSWNLANCHNVLPRSSTIFKSSTIGPKNAFVSHNFIVFTKSFVLPWLSRIVALLVCLCARKFIRKIGPYTQQCLENIDEKILQWVEISPSGQVSPRDLDQPSGFSLLPVCLPACKKMHCTAHTHTLANYKPDHTILQYAISGQQRNFIT